MTLSRFLRRAPDLALAAVVLLALGPALLRPDLNLHYPFPGGDGQDWIANGLALAGEGTRWSGRPPLLPGAIAALHRLGLLRFLPWLLLLAHAGLAVAAARFAVPDGDRSGGRRALLALFVILGAAFLSQGIEIMADVPATALATLALLAFAGGGERRGDLVRAGLWTGLAGLAQPAGLFPVVGIGCALAWRERRVLRTRWPWIGAALALLPTVVADSLRALLLGSGGDVVHAHRTLVGWHPEQLAFYRDALPSALGAPALVIALVGSASLFAPRTRLDARALAALASALAVALFFGLAYGWTSRRFVVYLVPMLALALDRGFELLRRTGGRAARGFAAAAALGGAALPATAERAFVAWPLPGVELDLEAGAIASPAPPSRLGAHPLARAWAAWPSRPRAVAIAARDFTDVEAALFLHGGSDRADNVFQAALRLGNAVGRRGRALPLAILPAGFLTADNLEPAPGGDGFRLYRFRPLADGPTWLLGLSASSPILLPPGASSPAPRIRARPLRTALAAARCADRGLPSRDSPLVVFGDERDAAVAMAAVATRTGTLVVVPPELTTRWRSVLAASPAASFRDCAGLRVGQVVWKGMRYTVATAAGRD